MERGLYTLPGTSVDEMYALYAKASFIVFSHLSALYLHDLTDRTPLKMTITVPRTKNISRLLTSGMIEVKRSNKQTHDLGLMWMPSPSGFSIPAYDMERTVCDIVRNRRHIDLQILTDALKSYVRRKDKNLTHLLLYAKVLRVEAQIREYMGVLL
jgi:predicted transcriptional regulator of viral defense system